MLSKVATLIWLAVPVLATFSGPLDIKVISPSGTEVNHRYYHPSILTRTGSVLKLKCSWGWRAVRWEESDSSLLTFNRFQDRDIGLHSCCAWTQSREKIFKECSSVYLFAEGDDIEPGSLVKPPSGLIALSVEQNQQAVIPCRPKSPNTRVQLKSLITGRMIQESGFGVKYDPTIGFILKRAKWTEEWLNMECSSDSSDSIHVVVHWSVGSLLPTEYPGEKIQTTVKEAPEHYKAHRTPEKNVTFTDDVRKYPSGQNSLPLIVAVIVLAAFVLVAIFIATWSFLSNKKAGNLSSTHTRTNGHEDSIETLHTYQQIGIYSLDQIDINMNSPIIPVDSLVFEPEVIGKGAYGEVYKARYGSRTVAVKRASPTCVSYEKENLREELDVLTHIGKHENIIAVIGVVTSPELMIVYEYCLYGNLNNYLQTTVFESHAHTEFAHRVLKCLTVVHPYYNWETTESVKQHRLCLTDLLNYSVQVAQAMEFLSNRQVIHRDLATRNVLVLSPNHVKLCDFGLSKNCAKESSALYMTLSSRKLPFKWMAPESLASGSFSTKTDVWSFGVLLWEVFELGKSPYDEMTGCEVANFLKSGGRLQKPMHAPDHLYTLMKRMWDDVPEKRPDFSEITANLNKISSIYGM